MQGFHDRSLRWLTVFFHRLCADEALTSTLPSSATLRRDATAEESSVRYQQFRLRGSCDRGSAQSRLLKLQFSRSRFMYCLARSCRGSQAAAPSSSSS